MGAKVSKWIKERETAGGWQQDAALELRLAHLLALLRERQGRARKTRTVATAEGAATAPLRTTDVVTEDTIK